MSTKPQRIQLSRRKGWRMPANTVKVDRTTPFGNPFAVAPATEYAKETRKGFIAGSDFVRFFTDKSAAAAHSVALFRSWIEHPAQHKLLAAVRLGLRGKNLACWCKMPAEGEPDNCHAAVLLEIANR